MVRQDHSRSSAKYSANKYTFPFGNVATTNDTHLPSANSGNSELSLGSPYSKEASEKSNFQSCQFCPNLRVTEILQSSEEASLIHAGEDPLPSGFRIFKCNCDEASRHLPKIKNASADEILFMELTLSFGSNQAMQLAAKLRLKCQRPLRALLAMMNERGKNYSESGLKREQRLISARSRTSRSGEALSSRMGCQK
jgi:hypothetical protein